MMKPRTLTLPLLIAAVCLAQPSHAQWTQSGGPWTGSYVASVHSAGGTLFAGTQFGVFLSTDGGERWTAAQSETGMGTVIDFLSHDSLLFAGTASSGVFRSQDGGKHWEAVNIGLSNFYVPAVVPYPNGSYLFAGTSSGVFRSSNNGESWTEVNRGLTSLGVRCLAFRPDGSLLFAGTSKGLFRSSDNGTQWTEVKGGIHKYVESLVYYGKDLFAATLDGIYRSTDDGTNWVKYGNGMPESNVYDIAVIGQDVFASLPVGVFRSTDGGANWTEANNGFPKLPMFRVFHVGVPEDGTRLFACTDGGMYAAEPQQLRWEPLNAGLPSEPVETLAARDSVLFAGTNGRGVYRSEDGGATWTEANTGLKSLYVRSIVAGRTHLYIATSGAVQRSSDDGITWTEMKEGTAISGVQCLAVAETPAGEEVVFAGTGFGAYFSTNNGARWENAELGANIPNVSAMAVQHGGDGGAVVYAGVTGYGICVTTDYGETWTVENSGLSNLSITALAADDEYVYAGCGPSVFRSRNYGRTWAEASAGLPGGRILELAALQRGEDAYVFACLPGGNVHSTADRGLEWTPVHEGIPETDVSAFAFSQGFAYAGTRERGVWLRPLAELIGSGGPPATGTYVLGQNYPNPLVAAYGGAVTTINYEVPAEEHVSLKVYNAAGMEVATILDERAPQGVHTAEFDAAGLPSGTYIYRLRAGGRIMERKMALVR